MLKKLLFVFTFFILAHKAHAQLYPFTIFNTSNGLVNNRCGTIAQDSAGYMWIGTDNGICNYDGRKFNFFPGHFNTYYFAHSQPAMYKGHCLMGAGNGGFGKCAGNKLEFIVPSAKNNGHIISTLAINDSTYLIARTGNHEKLLLLSGKTEKEIPVPEAISQKKMGFLLLLQDIEKNIWVTTNTGVMVFIKGNFEKPYVFPELIDKYNNCIKEDFEHNIFISSDGGVYKINSEKLKNIEQAKPFLFYQCKEHIPSLGFLHNGDILLGQMTAGVKVFSKNLQWIKDITGKNGLGNTVWDIFTDRERNTWFATDNGLLRLRDIDFIYFPSPLSAFGNITSGTFYNNSFVYANGASLNKIIDDKLYALPDNKNSPGYLFNRMLVTPDNELWINYYPVISATDMYYYTYKFLLENNNAVREDNIQMKYHLSSPVNIHQSIYSSPQEMLFLTEDNRLYLYTEKKVQELKADSNLIKPGFSLLAKGINKDEIWLLNAEKGLYHCKLLRQNNTVSLALLQAVSLPSDVLPTCSKIICAANSTVWVGTYTKGVLLYEKEAGRGYVYKKQITTPAISSVMVTTMLQDSAGNMWIGTNNGIDKIMLAGDSIYAITKGMFENKLSGRMIYFLKEKNNRLYIGTTGSLAIAKINSPYTKVSPLVYINHLGINNTNADSLLTSQNNPFEPDQNNISFEFVALSFINEKQTAYQYKLDGADTAWSSPSPNYTVTYAKLKPGSYTFRVRAKNADDTWSEQDAVFSFSIKKPFYQHWAFYFLCAGICCGLAYWLYRQKIARILAVEKTRQHISKDLHDDIGSTLSSITLMNAVLKNKIEKKPDEAAKLAEKIEDTSRQMIQNMSDIVWSINPGNDTMDKLQNRLQQFCADVFEDTNTVHKLSFSETLLKKTLPMQLRRDMYLVCKEITNNAAKYSRAKNFTLALSLDKKNIYIQAADDGIGFDTAAANTGNGLNNIRQRVAANKGAIRLETQNGTSWNITIPIE
ncbi:MAG TPA: two-component regulator propeller domain-containing protein [Ferruginibacter sp.]|nr:two-component regulator propeller domain-containing protein [Ferruginibacter sp.]HPH93010.1 two-component regulator propeller domain-containing protein [Ferruginibacter sp.]